MANKSGGASKTGQAAGYKANKVWERNRLRKLRRALKAHPNNEQILTALKGVVYRRKTPKTREWSASWKKVAQLYKKVTGRFDREIMSSNEKVAQAALSRPGPKSSIPLKTTMDSRDFFKLLTRVNMRGTN